MRHAKVTWCKACRTIGGQHLSCCPDYVRHARHQWIGGLVLAGALTLQVAQDSQIVHIDIDGDHVIDFTLQANVVTLPTGDLLVSSAAPWAGAPAGLPFVPSSEQVQGPPVAPEPVDNRPAPFVVDVQPPTGFVEVPAPPVDASECVAEGVPEWMCAPAVAEPPPGVEISPLAPPPSDVQAVPDAGDVLEVRRAKMSHYWPALGGVNCAVFVGGECVSTMADGTPWQQGIGTAAGCPREIPFGTRIKLPDGSVWTCQDRGSKVVTEPDGTIWLDLLEDHARYPYGEVVDVQILRWGW